MRILHVVPTYLPATRYGGPIFAVHGLAKALVAVGHDVHVYTTNVDGDGDSSVPLARAVPLDGVKVHYFRSNHGRRLYYSADLKKTLGQSVAEFDVVHLHSVFLYPTFVAARAAQRASVPYVLSPRGMLVRELIKARRPRIKRAWIAAIESSNLRHAATIHVTSNYERVALSELHLDLAPVAVIPNGVDQPTPVLHSDVADDVRTACAAGANIVSIGRINWKKGLGLLIRALERLPEARAIIAGNDEESYTEQLRTVARECNVERRVIFLSRRVEGADKEALFCAARLVVMPSISENFGNVAVEALARRKPVVVTESVGAAEIVAATGAGAVVRYDIDDLAATLRNLLALPDAELRRMGQAGQDYVRESLSWAAVASRLEDVYRRVSQQTSQRERQPALEGA